MAKVKPVHQITTINLVNSQAPNKINFSQFNPQNYSNETHNQANNFQMSKDGIENLKNKFYESASKSTYTHNPLSFYSTPNSGNSGYDDNNKSYDNKQPVAQISKVKLNKLSSHENYLFNSKNNFSSNYNNETQSGNYDQYSGRSN